MADKVPTLVESSLFNGGKRTALDAELGPNATTFAHYHTLFSETFEVLSGSIAVLRAPEGITDAAAMKEYPLQVGQAATVPKHTAHKFVAGKDGCRVLTSFEPGAKGFEQVALIMCGLQVDAEYKGWGDGANEDNALLVSALSELTDSHPVLENDIIMIEKQGTEDRVKFKQGLINKYATDEMIRSAVSKN